MSVVIHNLLRSALYICAPFVLVFGGCGFYDSGETVDEEEERSYQRGKQLLREGRQEDALSAFLRVIERRPRDAPESHLEAADIYLTHLEEPVEAIYHFRRHLEQKPNSPQADLVRGRINRAMKEFARTLPADPLRHPTERMELIASVEALESENNQLKRAVAELREEREELRERVGEAERRAEGADRLRRELREQEESGAASETRQRASLAESTQSEASGRDDGNSSRTETYTVRSGDTLYRISSRFYGTGSRWNEIYEANRENLPNANSVRAGMQLEIPLD